MADNTTSRVDIGIQMNSSGLISFSCTELFVLLRVTVRFSSLASLCMEG